MYTNTHCTARYDFKTYLDPEGHPDRHPDIGTDRKTLKLKYCFRCIVRSFNGETYFFKVANFPGNFSTLFKTFPKKITLRKGMDEMRCDGCWEIVYKIRPHEWAISGY